MLLYITILSFDFSVILGTVYDLTLTKIIFYLLLCCGSVWAIAVILLAIGLGRLRRVSSASLPRVTVLVAARNEEHNILNCLKALSAQDYPADLREIIIIDDNSTDQTSEIVENFIDTLSGFKLIRAEPTPIGIAPKKHALMIGINASDSDIIITTDADCQPPPGWLRNMAGCFTPDVDAVVGHSPLQDIGLTSALAHFDGFVNAVISSGTLGLGKASSSVGRNFAYRRTAFNEVGGFGSGLATASGDDDLLLQRIVKNGGKAVFNINPKSFVPAQGQQTLRGWWRMKRRHYSAGKHYNPALITIGIFLYAFNPLLIIATIMAAIGRFDPVTIAAIWGAKASIDGLALSRGARLLHEPDWLLSWLIAEFISPLILTVLLPLSMVGNVRWKDRSLRN
jgi:cellulose synthase/poly-beta-1,6-N-acetylglucosamine synthase-like glycosyltransferase